MTLTHGDLKVDLRAWRVFLGDEELHLSPKEFELLRTFIERVGECLTRADLLVACWGYKPEVAHLIHTRTVDTHVRRLRSKLGPWRENLVSVRGRGYRLNEELA